MSLNCTSAPSSNVTFEVPEIFISSLLLLTTEPAMDTLESSIKNSSFNVTDAPVSIVIFELLLAKKSSARSTTAPLYSVTVPPLTVKSSPAVMDP